MSKKEDPLTKYEKARVIGARALQLALGAPPLVDLKKVASAQQYLSAVELARKEFAMNVVPLHVLRA